jgi:hypothetical protein
MIMADVFKILFLILGLIITSISYWLLFEGLCTKLVDKAQRRYTERPWRTLFTGLAIGLPATFVAVAAMDTGPGGQFIGFVLASTLILAGLLGSTGLARHLGAQLHTEADANQPWRRVLRGGTVLAVACVLPVVGWFVVLPAILASGLGATVLVLVKRSKTVDTPDAPPEPV